MVAYRLAKPIVDNRSAFKARFPSAYYVGDVGDKAHMQGSGDHTPWSADVIFGKRMARGVVYAQDLGGGGGLDVAAFARFILDRLRDGAYPEVKYVITRHDSNRGRNGGRYYGLFDRRYNWRTQRSSGHSDYVHCSFMPGYESKGSRLVADYHDMLHGRLVAAVPAAAPSHLKKWRAAPPLPATPLGQYSTVPLNRLPYTAYPPLVPGLGGPGPQAPRDWVHAILSYAVGECRTGMITPGELERAELGAGAIAWMHMVTTSLAGNPWVNNPAANAKAFGAAIGAPANWK